MYDGTNYASVTKNTGEFGAISHVEVADLIRRANQMRTAYLAEMIAGALAAPVLRYRSWKAKRAAMRELESLDDRLLEDIGITRDQIRALTHAAPRVAAEERGRMLVDLVENLIAAPFRRWRMRNRTRRELAALDDTMLRDIGIERGQIDGIATAVAEGKLAAGTPVPVGLALGLLDLPKPANSNSAQPRPALVTDAAD